MIIKGFFVVFIFEVDDGNMIKCFVFYFGGRVISFCCGSCSSDFSSFSSCVVGFLVGLSFLMFGGSIVW